MAVPIKDTIKKSELFWCFRKSQMQKPIPHIFHSEYSIHCRFELETESDLDVDDYVGKPISPPILLQRVGKALLKRRAAGATSLTITKGGK